MKRRRRGWLLETQASSSLSSPPPPSYLLLLLLLCLCSSSSLSLSPSFLSGTTVDQQSFRPVFSLPSLKLVERTVVSFFFNGQISGPVPFICSNNLQSAAWLRATEPRGAPPEPEPKPEPHRDPPLTWSSLPPDAVKGHNGDSQKGFSCHQNRCFCFVLPDRITFLWSHLCLCFISTYTSPLEARTSSQKLCFGDESKSEAVKNVVEINKYVVVIGQQQQQQRTSKKMQSDIRRLLAPVQNLKITSVVGRGGLQMPPNYCDCV